MTPDEHAAIDLTFQEQGMLVQNARIDPESVPYIRALFAKIASLDEQVKELRKHSWAGWGSTGNPQPPPSPFESKEIPCRSPADNSSPPS